MDGNGADYFMFSPRPNRERILFKHSRVFCRFGFLISNPGQVQVLLCPAPIIFLKIIFNNFILYFNINTNN